MFKEILILQHSQIFKAMSCRVTVAKLSQLCVISLIFPELNDVFPQQEREGQRPRLVDVLENGWVLRKDMPCSVSNGKLENKLFLASTFIRLWESGRKSIQQYTFHGK